ncbi:tyrosine-protein kinase FRK-like [Planoprotostelium fungivorum]|uniref:Tyrosine-protein kinase FRK-like n=1 Tax=Planoprotostelium fungivorum TaxID=1890364 RepID=A0A2P6N9X7_9EUKA|nr:tyrosine-protein kinase FRK-like [Planoprotostelium fungivorum]
MSLTSTDPLATTAAMDTSYYSMPPRSTSQTGGFPSRGFRTIIQNSGTNIVVWPIDTSLWTSKKRNATVQLSYGSSAWSFTFQVTRRTLNQLQCKQSSPSVSPPNVNCYLGYTGADTTFYDATLRFKSDSIDASYNWPVLNVTNGGLNQTFNLSLNSVPRGPSPIKFHTWIEYDSYTTDVSLNRYPQKNYLSGNIHVVEAIVTFSQNLDSTTSVSIPSDTACERGYCLVTSVSNANWLDTTDHTGDDASIMLVFNPTDSIPIFSQSFDVSPSDGDHIISFYLLNLLCTQGGFANPNLNLTVTSGVHQYVFPLGELRMYNHPVWQYFSFPVRSNGPHIVMNLTDSVLDTNGNDFAIDDISIYSVVDAFTLSRDMSIRDASCDTSHKTLKFKGEFERDANFSVNELSVTQSPCGNGSDSSSSCSLSLQGYDADNVTLSVEYFGWQTSLHINCSYLSSSTTTSSTTTSSTTTSSTTTASSTIYTSVNADVALQVINNLKTNPNKTIDESTARNLMTSLASNGTSTSLSNTITTLGVVLMRGRENFNVSVGGISLSGVRVDGSSGNVSLKADAVRVNVGGDLVKEILQGGQRASVLLSTTANNALSSLSQTPLYSDIIGLSVTDSDGNEISVKNTRNPILLTIIPSLPLPPSSDYNCMYFDEISNSWDNVTTISTANNETVICSTNHLTNFSVGVVPKVVPISQREEKSSTPLIYIVAPAVAGACLLILLSLVIVFLVLRKKKRQSGASEIELGVKGHKHEKNSIRVGDVIAGRVYIGYPDTGSFVALKRTTGADSQKNDRELNAYLKLRHPNIVQFLSTYTDDHDYLVLGHMPSGSLFDYAKKGCDDHSLTRVIIDVASALRYMEEMNMVHCNLTASSVLLYQEGGDLRGKVCSFGSCCSPCTIEEKQVRQLALRWTAPEVLKEGRCTVQSDVWSFGIMIYECMEGGAIPYCDSEEDDVRVQISKSEGPTPSHTWSSPYPNIFRECVKERKRRANIRTVLKMLMEDVPQDSEKGSTKEVVFDENQYQTDALMTTNSNGMYVAATKSNPFHEK